MDVNGVTREYPLRFAGSVVAISLVVTASLLGVVSVFSGDFSGLRSRLPFTALVTAVGFVVTLYKLDDEHIDGVTVLIATSGIAIGIGVLFSFSVEGLLFGIRNPGDIVASHLLLYFLAAGIFCTGLGMWSLKHWREFTADVESEESSESESDS